MKEKCNILLSLMKLDIGGAETHVVELAKELKRRGHNVIVTSNGGVYTRELEDFGIKHYTVPLQNKNPLNVIKAFKLLRKIITDENIDIVHSHARIPSFILGKLHKRMKFPFVTTAHWVFTTKYGLKYITDWGQQTVAVSEDIKQYLMDNYGIPAENIIVTINGIDTEKFSPDISCSRIKKEFAVREEDNTIVYVSRLDESRSLVAKQLLSAFENLSGKIANLKLVIVGDGDDFMNVEKAADEINKRLGTQKIKLAGARTNINEFAVMGKLFVGVSRAALEAMSAQKPVIIAGNEGYIGLFDEDKLDLGIETNFCCRGCVQSDARLLENDISAFFALPDSEKERLGRYGREVIKKHYSVYKMTDDNIEAYKRVLE